MESKEKVLSKIKKLLALGQSSNPNESATAIAHAQRLMEKYEIDQALLETPTEEDDEEIKDWNDPLDGLPQKSLITWKSRLGLTLGAHNGVFIWRKGGALMLVGKASDVQTVRYMYAYCAKEGGSQGSSPNPRHLGSARTSCS